MIGCMTLRSSRIGIAIKAAPTLIGTSGELGSISRPGSPLHCTAKARQPPGTNLPLEGPDRQSRNACSTGEQAWANCSAAL